jgi:hypothetical protein
MVRRYQTGQTMPEVARSLGRSVAVVWMTLIDRGVRLRPQGTRSRLPADRCRGLAGS